MFQLLLSPSPRQATSSASMRSRRQVETLGPTAAGMRRWMSMEGFSSLMLRALSRRRRSPPRKAKAEPKPKLVVGPAVEPAVEPPLVVGPAVLPAGLKDVCLAPSNRAPCPACNAKIGLGTF
eukprot:4559951-Pyramimonas_sp.AAC.1